MKMFIYYTKITINNFNENDLIQVSVRRSKNLENNNFECFEIDLKEVIDDLQFYEKGKDNIPIRKTEEEINSILANRKLSLNITRGEKIKEQLGIAGYIITKE